MSRPYQIVLDTNVLIAAFRSQRGASNKLLTLLSDPRWQINLSTPLLLEYEEALKRPGMIEGFSDTQSTLSSMASVLLPTSMIFSTCGVR